MAYTIRIGELVIHKEPQEIAELLEDGLAPYYHVKPLFLEEAPSFKENINDQMNVREPGYSVWDNFLIAVGLKNMFMMPQIGLMHQHPGWSKILPMHLTRIEEALAEWKAKYPEAVPQFETTEADAALLRLEWLAWWFKWALDNCKMPAIYNH